MIKYTSMANPLEFIRSVKVELAFVKWPSHEQTLRLTATVILVSLLVGLYIGGLDIVFTSLLQRFVNR